MRIFCAAAMIALLAGPAYAQTRVPQYGDVSTPKSPSEIAAEKATEKAYDNSLGNIPDHAPVDPWGNARSTDAPKSATNKSATKAAAARTAPAKRAKVNTTRN